MMTADRDRWPVDLKARPLPPRSQPGYYPGYESLSQKESWDEATRRLVVARVERVPPIRFFSPDEARLLAAVCDRTMPQDDRDDAHRIPIVHFIDDRLFSGRSSGYRYEDMPPDDRAHRLGLRGIEAAARSLFGRAFLELTPHQQDVALKSIHDGKPAGGDDVWRDLPPHRYWLLLMADVVEAYYAHPYAWDEIGFGGPAYPRGYMRLENGLPEPWEVDERRYEWRAPPTSLSGEFGAVGGSFSHLGAPGQGGTH
jgi:hypothetical protein